MNASTCSADARGLGGQGSIVEEVAEVRDCVLISAEGVGREILRLARQQERIEFGL